MGVRQMTESTRDATAVSHPDVTVREHAERWRGESRLLAVEHDGLRWITQPLDDGRWTVVGAEVIGGDSWHQIRHDSRVPTPVHGALTEIETVGPVVNPAGPRAVADGGDGDA